MRVRDQIGGGRKKITGTDASPKLHSVQILSDYFVLYNLHTLWTQAQGSNWNILYWSRPETIWLVPKILLIHRQSNQLRILNTSHWQMISPLKQFSSLIWYKARLKTGHKITIIIQCIDNKFHWSKEVPVKFFVINRFCICFHGDSRIDLHNNLLGDFSLRLPNMILIEQKLSIEIWDFYCI